MTPRLQGLKSERLSSPHVVVVDLLDNCLQCRPVQCPCIQASFYPTCEFCWVKVHGSAVGLWNRVLGDGRWHLRNWNSVSLWQQFVLQGRASRMLGIFGKARNNHQQDDRQLWKPPCARNLTWGYVRRLPPLPPLPPHRSLDSTYMSALCGCALSLSNPSWPISA